MGKRLAEVLGLPYFEGDDFHPEANITKMSEGRPLDDDDRKPWLESLNLLARKHSEYGAVIACSALKKSYRDILEAKIPSEVIWVYLSGSFETISERLKKRQGHFMPPSLLRSQFDILEAPENAIVVPIDLGPDKTLQVVLDEIGK